MVTPPDAGSDTLVESTFTVLDPTAPRRSSHRRGRPLPTYLTEPYAWAYLNRTNARLLDNDAVVTAILLGNHRRLREAVLSEVTPGSRVIQAAHVYGCLIPELARRIGPDGRLDVIDLVPLQAALCRRKLNGMPHARVRVADATEPGDAAYDVACAFFLLHEIPDAQKRCVVDALIGRVVRGGKAVFVDYHGPARWHPLRPAFRQMFARLEPFAGSLWRTEIRDFATDSSVCRWEKRTLFGGLYQVVVAHRL